MAEEGQKVTLNVYDLSQGLARQLSTTFLGRAIEGIWQVFAIQNLLLHCIDCGTGVLHIEGEYLCIRSNNIPLLNGKWHTGIVVFGSEYYFGGGDRSSYTAETYNLLRHNCNNFSNEVALFLVGTNIPDYILELPNDVLSSPMGANDITHDTTTRDNIEIRCCSPSASAQTYYFLKSAAFFFSPNTCLISKRNS
ncbi:hypothetical protein C5167_041386 [Papaver somniferum]|nr:hypothetical protein C5167_041386 [Papaver somniferum]